MTADTKTCYVAPYTIHLREGDGRASVSTDTVPDESDCAAAAGDWARGADWGVDGAAVEVWWSVSDAMGRDMDLDGSCTVDIEPDHAAKISEACGGRWDGRCERSCGTDPDDHDWTGEGEGGCGDNPGVWATSGTSMSFSAHCRKCGLQRRERTTGSQRDPGEHDTVSYEMPHSWCGECQRDECGCDTE